MPAADDPDGRSARTRADLALSVLAVDPSGVGGLWLRARSGPARDRFLAGLDRLDLARRKVHPNIGEDQLFGGLDVSATLAEGRQVTARGLLSDPAVIVLTMAERCPSRLAAHLGGAIDRGTHPVIALDEGAEADECAPPGLTERLGLFVTLDGIAGAAAEFGRGNGEALRAARDRLPAVTVGAGAAETLVTLAARLGIASLRAPLQAIAAARALAALSGRMDADDEDARLAAELVYAHRATALPDTEEPPQEDDAPTPPEEEHGGEAGEDAMAIPEDLLVEAVAAALPPDVLARLAGARAARTTAGVSGTGAARKGNRRGRPLPSRPGRLDSDRRIDLVATLRAAAPWQPMRRAAAPAGHRIHIRPSDVRLRRFEETSDRLLIFAVDASGSLAMSRLAEAKGAVELLLSEAYARRDHVALLAFRGDGAELLLPPTRSLLQTKRRLQALPGGGGTPLAAGLHLGLEAAHQAARRGMTPTIAVLTDGRANIALDGRADRAGAAADAERMARLIRAEGVATLVIDTAPRPQRGLAGLAAAAGGEYIALPRADAHRLSTAVSAALDG